jgi:hypothetical protein
MITILYDIIEFGWRDETIKSAGGKSNAGSTKATNRSKLGEEETRQISYTGTDDVKLKQRNRNRKNSSVGQRPSQSRT